MAHLAYIRHLLQHGWWPAADACGVCHHPPLYYLLAAQAWRAGELVRLADPARAVQALSLLLTGVFVFFSVGTFRLLLPRAWQHTLATALLAFWPYTIIQSVRINPDVAVNAVSAVALYCLARWWRWRSARWLLAGGLLALLGLFVKASGLALVAAMFSAMLFAIWRSRDRIATLRATSPMAASLAAVTIASGYLRGASGDSLSRRVLGTAFQTSGMAARHPSADFYLWFDVGAFLKSSDGETVILNNIAPTFWNHWLKSSLFGTVGTSRGPFRLAAVGPNETFGSGLMIMLLMMVTFVVVGLWLARRERSDVAWFAASTGLAYVTVAVGFHVLVPIDHHADFRLVFPVLLPWSLLVADVAGRLRAGKRCLWHAGYVLASQWTALSLVYFVPGCAPARYLPAAEAAAEAAPPAASAGSTQEPGPSPSASREGRRVPSRIPRPGGRAGRPLRR